MNEYSLSEHEPRRTGGPTLRQQQSRDTRERLTAAAERVFARRGYGEATVADIAAEAGISMGAMYRHFRSKEELFRSLLDEHLRADLVELAGLPPPSSFRELIEGLVAFWLQHVQDDDALGSLFPEFCAHAAREEWARGPLSELFRTGRELIAGTLRIGQSAGAVRPDLDVDGTAAFLHAALTGIAIEHAIDPDGLGLRTAQAGWADLIERAVSAPDAKADNTDTPPSLIALLKDFEQRTGGSPSSSS